MQDLTHDVEPIPEAAAIPASTSKRKAATQAAATAPKRPRLNNNEHGLLRYFSTSLPVSSSKQLPRSENQIMPAESAQCPSLCPPPTGSHTLADVHSPLPLPADSSILTRSQHLVSRAIGIDIRALSISEDAEFYLFMEMRAEFRWSTFTMTSHKWALATVEYNKRLKTKSRAVRVVLKNPRALINKLVEIEDMILIKISTGQFKCTSHSCHPWF